MHPTAADTSLYRHTNIHTKQGGNLNLPLALAQQLLDPADANSLTAPNTPEAKARKGLLLWAGPATGKPALLTHFQVTVEGMALWWLVWPDGLI